MKERDKMHRNQIAKLGLLLTLVLVMIFTAACQPQEKPAEADESAMRTQAAETVIAGIVETGVADALKPKITRTPAPPDTPEPVIPTVSSAKKDEIKKLVEEALGPNNRGLPTLTEFDIGDLDESVAYVKWPLDENQSEEKNREAAKADAAAILQIIKESGINYLSAILSATYTVVDEDGNAYEDIVVNLTYDKVTIDSIDWQNFQTANTFSIADESYIQEKFQ